MGAVYPFLSLEAAISLPRARRLPIRVVNQRRLTE